MDMSARSYISNSYALKLELQEFSVAKDDMLVSFDVVALYPSVPVSKALDIILEKLRDDPTLPERCKWAPEQIIKLLKICLETNFVCLDGLVYTQVDGNLIGKFISGPIAGIYMAWFEETFVFKNESNWKPTFWKRMKDDVLCIWPHGREELDLFLADLNSKEQRIQFTLEIEEDKKIHFLDLWLERTDTGKIIKPVF